MPATVRLSIPGPHPLPCRSNLLSSAPLLDRACYAADGSRDAANDTYPNAQDDHEGDKGPVQNCSANGSTPIAPTKPCPCHLSKDRFGVGFTQVHRQQRQAQIPQPSNQPV